MSERREYTAEQKAQVIAALLAGQGVSEVAKQYELPEGTVKAWKSREVATQKREDIGDLLVEYLHTNLTTLQKQSVVFSDAKWLVKQNAADLAVLHGVLTDKTIRLLDALGNASASS